MRQASTHSLDHKVPMSDLKPQDNILSLGPGIRLPFLNYNRCRANLAQGLTADQFIDPMTWDISAMPSGAFRSQQSSNHCSFLDRNLQHRTLAVSIA
jgi:hypothetical protein